MKKILIAITLVLKPATVFAQDHSPVIASELTVLPASTVLQRDRVALLGEHAVLTKAAARTYASEQIDAKDRLFVVAEPSSGRLGTTDGGMIVVLYSPASLDGLAADYGLTVKHVFSAQPAAVLISKDKAAVNTFVAKLRDDDRVVSAELNVNYYQEQAY